MSCQENKADALDARSSSSARDDEPQASMVWYHTIDQAMINQRITNK